MSRGVCSIPGCRKPAWSRSWCTAHYRRWYLYGDPQAERPTGRPFTAKPCVVDGCDGPAVARGWCSTHYNRWRRKGDPLAATRRYTRA